MVKGHSGTSKILIIRFSSLGDIVLTSPVIRCLKKQLKAEVHFLTKKSFAQILEPNPYLDKLWTIQSKVSEITSALKAEKYTHIIDLHNNIRSDLVKWLLPGAAKLTYQKGTLSKLKRIYFKTPSPKVHVVDRYMQPLKKMGVQHDGAGVDFFIPESVQIDWKEVGVQTGEFIAFVIGAAHFTKRLPTTKILEICNEIERPIVLLGGPDEQETGDQIVKLGKQKIINLAGQLNLMESARVVENAMGVISHDTGFMHIAAALGKPLISIWGSTDPNLGFWPYFGDSVPAVNYISEVQNLSCRPCSKFGRSACPKGHFNCMNQQDIPSIVEKAHLFG